MKQWIQKLVDQLDYSAADAKKKGPAKMVGRTRNSVVRDRHLFEAFG